MAGFTRPNSPPHEPGMASICHKVFISSFQGQWRSETRSSWTGQCCHPQVGPERVKEDSKPGWIIRMVNERRPMPPLPDTKRFEQPLLGSPEELSWLFVMITALFKESLSQMAYEWLLNFRIELPARTYKDN